MSEGNPTERPLKKQKVEMIGQIIKVEDFFEERRKEIETMETAISQSKANLKVRVFQTVARYQRRRAASHNPKRLPKHLRQRATEQIMRDNNPVKELSRRKKRNPKRLTQFKLNSKRWLETHIWHAKRMKMIDRNGIMTPLTPNQKCFRSMYRAAKNEATCVDASWKNVVEICGQLQELSALLESIADPSLSSFTSEMYLNGNRSGKQFIHHTNRWPLHGICPVDFLWRPKGTDLTRTCWIWVDSYCYEAVYELISNIVTPKLKVRKIERLNRFEIDGPRSHAILSHTLLLATNNSLWKSFKDLNSPGILQEGIVFSLDIHDPRVTFPRLMPPKDDKGNILDQFATDALSSWPLESVNDSKIWDIDYHSEILNSRASNSEISSRRAKVHSFSHQNLIPGSKLDPIETDPHIPILLIRRRDQGWDLIAPMGWAPSLLNLFVFAGIRVGGTKEMENYQFECGRPSFPSDYPESLVQDQLAIVKEKELMKRHLTKPKDKRPAFKGIDNPFKSRFCDILGLETGPVGVFHSPHVVLIIDRVLKSNPKDFGSFMEKLLTGMRNLVQGRANFKSLDNLNAKVLDSMFVRVYLTCNSGNLKEDSVIHAKLESDDLDIPIPKELVFGYTTKANFSLLNRKCTAIGTCTLKGIFNSNKTKTVYIRSRTDRKSRIANFKIIP